MAGISSARAGYTIATAASIDSVGTGGEGLPVLEHFDIVPVTDSAGGPNTMGESLGRDASYQKSGGTYYIASPRIPFSPAHAALLLDPYFEDVAVGASPGYTRGYTIDDIPAEPSTWLTIIQSTAKPSIDKNFGGYGGVVNSFSLSGAKEGPLVLQTQIAFAHRDESITTASAADWDISETGNSAIQTLRDLTTIIGPVTEGGLRTNIQSFALTLSHAIKADFWSGRSPWRISRIGWRLSGEFVMREIDDDVEEFSDYWRADTPLLLVFASWNYTVVCNFAIRNIERFPAEGTFHFRVSFEGISNDDPAGSFEAPLTFNLTPSRTY